MNIDYHTKQKYAKRLKYKKDFALCWILKYLRNTRILLHFRGCCYFIPKKGEFSAP